LPHFGDVEILDEAHHLAQCAVDVPGVGPDLRDAEHRALPEIVVIAFRNRDVEGVGDTGLDLAQHAALALQRVVLGDEERQLQHTDDHGRARALQRAFGGGAARHGGAEAADDLFHLIGFDHVAALHILVVVEADAALVARLYLAGVVLEPAQAADFAGVDDDVVADQPGRRVARHLAVADEAAGDRPDAGDAEGVAHFGPPLN